MNATRKAINWVEQGLLPDSVIRSGIRRLLKQRLRDIQQHDMEAATLDKQQFIEAMDTAPIALLTDRANEQHYEIPPDFYDRVLGPYGKYSCSYWNDNTRTLEAAERQALLLTCEHAGLEDGQDVLELGCGWGSLSLWMAQRYPNSRITAVSNSGSQRAYIEQQAEKKSLGNLQVITCDMNDFDIDRQFDRVVSVEMFEHMRNWRQLFSLVSQWLRPDGLFFMHVFAHRSTPYSFEVKDAGDWMSEYFFSGGMMPSDDLALHFQQHLQLQQHWVWDGRHYEKTANAWLKNMDNNRDALWPIIESVYGVDQAQNWWMRWRMFFMACAELFGYDDGQQWWVSHYLFSKHSGRLHE